MNLTEFLEHDLDIVTDELKTPAVDEPATQRISTKSWRAQIERVLDAYIGECERYRQEHKALQAQVNEMARALSELRGR